MKCTKLISSGSFIYRRRVPQDILGVIGKREFKPALGATDWVTPLDGVTS